jgi:MFS family permease
LQSRPVLRNLSYIAALTNFFLNATYAIFVLYALEVLKLHPAGFGVLLSIEAVGVLAGSLLAARIRSQLGMGPTILVALSIAGLGNLVIGTTGNVVLVAAMMISIAFCGGLWNVITNSFRQAMVPDHLLGRVQSAHRLLSWGAIPLGSLFGGIVAETLGIKAPFLIASAALCVLAVAAFAMFAAPAPAAVLSE